MSLDLSTTNLASARAASDQSPKREPSVVGEVVAGLATLAVVGLCVYAVANAPATTRTITVTRTVFVPVKGEDNSEKEDGNIIVR